MRILGIQNSDYGTRHMANVIQYAPIHWVITQWRAPIFFPLVIDYPEEFLPGELPAVDLILSFAEHRGVAELIPDIAKMTGAQAVIAAIDNENSLPRGLARQINEYKPTGPAHVELKLKAGEGSGATEAPRGLLYHRYKIDANGMVQFAKITPPTAQNLPRIEADLFALVPRIINMESEATLTAEHRVRSYDPCISCATHFLKLKVEEK